MPDHVLNIEEIGQQVQRARRPVDPIRAAHEERLRPRTVAELRCMQAPRWLIRGVLPQRSLILVWGASGSGKTFMMLDQACSISRGERWFGKRVHGGGVVYVAGEGHLKFRLDAYLKHHQLSDEQLSGLRAIPSAVDLLDASEDLAPLLAQLQRAAEEMGGVSLVVLDTLATMMPGGNENAPEDMGAVMGAARKIMQALNCAVAFVHHGGKDEGRGARGHSSLRAAVDTEVVVKDNGEHRLATIMKQRDGEIGAEFAFRLRSVDLGPSNDPDADEDERESSCVVVPLDAPPPATRKAAAKLPKGAEAAFKALRDAIVDHGEPLPATSHIPAHVRAVQLEVWRRRYYVADAVDVDSADPAQREKAIDARLKRFTRARLALLNAGSIGAGGEWHWVNL